jgi:hypothetical protein
VIHRGIIDGSGWICEYGDAPARAWLYRTMAWFFTELLRRSPGSTPDVGALSLTVVLTAMSSALLALCTALAAIYLILRKKEGAPSNSLSCRQAVCAHQKR